MSTTWLFATCHATWPIGVYIAICSAIAIVCTMMLPDYTNKEIGHECTRRRPEAVIPGA